MWFGDEGDGQFLFGDDDYEFSSSYVFTLYEGVEASIEANAADTETSEPTPAPSPLPTTSSPTSEPSPGPTTNNPTLSPISKPTSRPTTSPTHSPTNIWEIQRPETSDAIGLRWTDITNTPPGEFNDVGGNQEQFEFGVDRAENVNGATRVGQIVFVTIPTLLLSASLVLLL